VTDGIYYTLRRAVKHADDRPIFELTKWESGVTVPLDNYVMWLPYRKGGELSFHSCNCPSRAIPCKHFDMAKALIAAIPQNGGWENLVYFFWQEGKVEYTMDVVEWRHIFDKVFDHDR
jgi:hypothetical protein